MPDATCVVAPNRHTCQVVNGGYYYGPQVDCKDPEVACEAVGPGACCLADGSCVAGVSLEWCCFESDDDTAFTPGGDCATCDSVIFGACCLPSGECQVWQEPGCLNLGGIWRGEGVTCGDFNGNGIPDTCEAIGSCRSDGNDDGVVDIIDFLTLLQAWGPCK